MPQILTPVYILLPDLRTLMVCFSIEEPLGLFDELYDKPWTRLGPYVVGMCAGWVLFRTNCTIKMHKVGESSVSGSVLYDECVYLQQTCALDHAVTGISCRFL